MANNYVPSGNSPPSHINVHHSTYLPVDTQCTLMQMVRARLRLHLSCQPHWFPSCHKSAFRAVTPRRQRDSGIDSSTSVVLHRFLPNADFRKKRRPSRLIACWVTQQERSKAHPLQSIQTLSQWPEAGDRLILIRRRISANTVTGNIPPGHQFGKYSLP